MPLPIPSNTRVAVDVQIAPGADLTTGHLSWPWVSLNEFGFNGRTRKRMMKQSDLSITSGRSSESDSLPSPGSMSFTVNNSDGAFTPGNPTSIYYPGLRLGTPCRVLVPGTAVALVTDGDLANHLSTPDAAALDIVGDIDLRYEGDIDWWTKVGAAYGLIGKWDEPAEFSYVLAIQEGFLGLIWSVTGGPTYLGQQATERLPWAKGPHAVRVTMDVSNAGNHVLEFWTADDRNSPWVQLGDTITLPGTTSIHSGTAPLRFAGPDPITGRSTWGQVRNGIDGTVVAEPDITAQPAGTTSFADGAGRTWTVQGNAEITNLRTRRMLEISERHPLSVQPEPKTIARTTVNASGVLRRLQQGEEPLNSVLYRAITSPTLGNAVIAAWLMEDESGATSFSSPIAGVAPATFGGTVSLSSDDTLAAAKGLPHIASGDGFGWTGKVPARTLTQWMATCFAKVTTPTGTETILLDVTTTGTAKHWRISVTNAVIYVRGYDSDGTEIYANGVVPSEFFDGWTQVNLELTQSGGNVSIHPTWLTINGNVYGYTDTIAGTVGHPTAVNSLFTAPGADGMSTGPCAITTGLGSGWLGWNEGANSGYVGEPAARRFGRLCVEEGIPVRLIGDPEMSTPMGPQRPLAFTTLLQDCAAADGGAPGEIDDRLGLSYRTRASFYNQAPALILDCDDRALADLAPTEDDRARRTHFTASRTDGSSATYVDPDFDPSTDRPYSDSATYNVETDAQLDGIAAWQVHLGGGDARWENVTAKLTSGPRTDAAVLQARVDAWLDLGYGDVVRALNPPAGLPPGPVDQIVDQIVDNFTSDTWTGGVVGSPGDPYRVGVLEDPILGRADTAGSELASTETTTDTSWSVATTSGPRWIDSAAYPSMFPFGLTVAGEEVTVTAITGTSSPQTFTVIRSANGVVKSHAAGTSIRLADQMIAAL